MLHVKIIKDFLSGAKKHIASPSEDPVGLVKTIAGSVFSRTSLLAATAGSLILFHLGRPDMAVLFGAFAIFVFFWPYIKKVLKFVLFLLAVYGAIVVFQAGIAL